MVGTNAGSEGYPDFRNVRILKRKANLRVEGI